MKRFEEAWGVLPLQGFIMPFSQTPWSNFWGDTIHETCFAKTVADRMIFMDGGKIIEQNSPQAFFDNPQQ